MPCQAHAALPSRRRLWLTLAAVGVAVAAWCAPGAWARASYGARVTADEPQYLLTAISLGEDRDLNIADERAEGRYRDFHAAALPVQELTRADRVAVSPHDPLLPAVLAVPMLVGGWVAAKLTLAALAGVLAAAMVWVAVRRFGVQLWVATVTVLAFAVAAPLSIYATQVYPELPGALALTVVLGALLGPRTRANTVVLVASLAALPWLSVKYVGVTAALAAVALVPMWRAGDRRRVAVVAGSLAVLGLLSALAHQRWYGGWTVYASGDHFVDGESTVMGVTPDYLGRSLRLLGLLDDRSFGLVAWQPAYLLAIPAFAALVARRAQHWVALALPFAVGWCTATFVVLTMHGWWWPGRQTVVVLPCAVLAIAWWAHRYEPARVLVAVGGVLGAVFAAWTVTDVLAGHMTLIFDFARTTNPVVRGWRLVLPDGLLQPSGTTALRVAWLVVCALLAWWGVRSARTPSAIVSERAVRPALRT